VVHSFWNKFAACVAYNIGGEIINLLCFADDMVLLAVLWGWIINAVHYPGWLMNSRRPVRVHSPQKASRSTGSRGRGIVLLI